MRLCHINKKRLQNCQEIAWIEKKLTISPNVQELLLMINPEKFSNKHWKINNNCKTITKTNNKEQTEWWTDQPRVAWSLVTVLIIYMKKFLHPDWLREVQFLFLIKTKQKQVTYNSVQKEVTNQVFWLVNDQRNSQKVKQIF